MGSGNVGVVHKASRCKTSPHRYLLDDRTTFRLGTPHLALAALAAGAGKLRRLSAGQVSVINRDTWR